MRGRNAKQGEYGETNCVGRNGWNGWFVVGFWETLASFGRRGAFETGEPLDVRSRDYPTICLRDANCLQNV